MHDRIDAAITVLHLDDDPDLLELATRRIEDHHHRLRVETTTSPPDALDRIAEGGVDCVVTDYKMSEMDGLAFLQAVREDHPDLPVVFFTGRGSEEIASEAISAGVTDYLRKGTNAETFALLGNRILTLVDHRRSVDAARKADERVRQLYERMTAAFFALDAEWRFSYLNQQATRLFEKLADEELLGEHAWTVLPSLAESDFQRLLETAVESGESVTGEGYLAELDSWLQVRAYPGEEGVSVFVEDVTDLRTTQEELQKVNEQFRTFRQKVSKPAPLFR